MIQDIYPDRLDNSFGEYTLTDADVLLFFGSDGRLLADVSGGTLRFPAAEGYTGGAVYLFTAAERRYFLADGECTYSRENFAYYTIRELRDRCSAGTGLFAAFTAYHLWRWYADNRFCGRCGGALGHKRDERALVCPACNNVIYPRINPAVIVGVMNGDRLLITRYSRGYAHNALVAGFAEIGETLEQTVEREVMEETGIRVTNIRYYRSQPWGMAQDMLVGFFCEADGSCEIHMDENELKYAEWVKREDIVLQPNALSLTNEMMGAFKYNRVNTCRVYESLLEGTANTRELGGHRTTDGRYTASGKILRSDAPTVYVGADAEKLRRNGFTVLIDMRTDEETARKPCAYGENEGFEYHNFPINEGSKPPAAFEDVPVGYMAIASSQGMADALRTIAAAEGNVMFFCTAGKDRTGVLTALILLACGADRQEIIYDYALSRVYNRERLEEYLAAHPDTDRRIVLAKETSMERFMEMFFAEYGSVSGYFERMGLSAEMPGMIRGRLL